MPAMLNEKELAGLHSTLEAPLAVLDILSRNEEVSEDEHMALAILFSEMKSVQALVAMACCAQRIAASLGHDRPLSATLSINADFIIDDYGPAWLQHQRTGKKLPENWYPEIQEDLETLADIFGVIQDSVFDQSAATSLCAILRDHALAHAEMLSVSIDDDIFAATPVEIIPEIEPQQVYYGDNVIPFPKARRH